jgi:hypothetical protein
MADNPSKDTSLQSTKQMLDELDALMERMLSLPVNELDEAPESPQEPANGPSLAASLTLLEPTETTDHAPTVAPSSGPPEAPPVAATPAKTSEPSLKSVLTSSAPPKKMLDRRPKTSRLPPLTPRAPLTPRSPLALKGAARLAKFEAPASAKEAPAPPAKEPPPLNNEVVPPTVLPNLEPLLSQVPARSGSSVLAWPYAPLLAINQIFDRLTESLGSMGRWLRSRAGRAALGGSGVILLFVAAFWMLRDWLGWHW